MSFQNPDDQAIANVLKRMRNVAVVGISLKTDRPSHGIARFLIGQGIEVYGVNPLLDEVLGIKVYPSLADIPGPIDLVDVFRRSDTVPPVVAEAIAVGAGAIWLQEGVIHEEAAAKATEAGIEVVMDRCLYKEWLRLMNG